MSEKKNKKNERIGEKIEIIDLKVREKCMVKKETKFERKNNKIEKSIDK